MAFVAMDAQFRTSIECQELGVPFVPCDLFASQDDANGTGGTDGDDDSVQCSQYRQLASQTQNKDASQKQWEDISFDLLEEDDFDMPEEGEFVLRAVNSEITSTSRQRETEVLDGESRWGEPDDDTQQKGNGNTEKATKTAMRTFERH